MSRKPKPRKRKQSRVPGMRRPSTPSWRVNLVGFGACNIPGCTEAHDDDPDAAFGYTVGLFNRHRLDELHLPAAAEDGNGRLDYMTVGRVLNQVGRDLVARTCRPGDNVAFTGVVDHGTIVCHLGEPVSPDEVQAFQVHQQAAVIPVTWTASGHQHDKSITIGARQGGAIVHITYTGEKIDETDSGFILEYEGAPPPWEYTPDDFGVLCMGCLIDDYPEVGRGLDLARRHGNAELVDGRWVSPHYEWKQLEKAVANARGPKREAPAA